jgi:hypothetical protein
MEMMILHGDAVCPRFGQHHTGIDIIKYFKGGK